MCSLEVSLWHRVNIASAIESRLSEKSQKRVGQPERGGCCAWA